MDVVTAPFRDTYGSGSNFPPPPLVLRLLLAQIWWGFGQGKDEAAERSVFYRETNVHDRALDFDRLQGQQLNSLRSHPVVKMVDLYPRTTGVLHYCVFSIMLTNPNPNTYPIPYEMPPLMASLG